MTFLRSSALLPLVLLCGLLSHACMAQAQPKPAVRELHMTFTTIDVPGAVFTIANGINSAGQIVGNYGQSTSNDSHGFLLTNGTFAYFDYPAVPDFTVPLGINDGGLIVGYAGQGPVYSFTYDGTAFTPVKLGRQTTFANGINNAGQVVGGAGTIYTTQGFEKQGQKFKRLYPPGSFVYVFGMGINNFGKVVGHADENGWLYANGAFKTIAFPGAFETRPLGINDHGVVVGWYNVGSFSYGFVLKNGKYYSFGFPGALFTAAGGINNAGQIVGGYTDDFTTWHAFVTSPITELELP
ncbi:MAG: DUF3466 family protein [Acidobacteriia bacterium]|nr:DUF3466 family protein [Terriglobia bacterium]